MDLIFIKSNGLVFSFFVLVYYLPMTAIAAADLFDMWHFSKTVTLGIV